MSSEPELLPQIMALVAAVLGLDVDEVRPDQNFFHDLGGESIDLIDLQFRVGKELGISVQFQELSSNRWSLDDEGRLTDESRAQLSEAFPFLTGELDGLQKPADLLTVRRIAEFVEFAGMTAAKR